MSIESLKSGGRGLLPTNGGALTEEQIRLAVEEVLRATQFADIHTHLYAPAFGKLGLWVIDELLTYHYLEAEFLGSSDITPERYWSLSKLRLLVVIKQSFDCEGDHSRAHRDVGNEFYSTTLRCPCSSK